MIESTLQLISKVVTSRDGTKIYAEACGDPSKQSIVFIHGFACSNLVYDRLFALPELQKNLFLVRYEMRGHGRSDKPVTEEAYESARFADDFDAVCEAFNLNQPFYAGWSYSGSILADICTAHNPVPIKGAIWFGALPYFGDILPIVASPYVLSLLPGICDTKSLANGLEARTKFASGLIVAKDLDSLSIADLGSWIGAASLLPPKCGELLLARKQDATRLREEAAKGLPLCIIHGTEDLYLLADKVVEQMRPHFKVGSTHLLEGIGHMPFWEDPSTVASLLLAFVRNPTGVKN